MELQEIIDNKLDSEESKIYQAYQQGVKQKKVGIAKEDFVDILDQLKEQLDYDKNITNKFQEIFKNDFLTGIDNNLYSLVVKMLSKMMHDDYEMIGYFVWELDFGKKWTESTLTKDGVSYDISTAGKLWEYLKDENDNR